MSLKWIVGGLLVASVGAYAYADYQTNRELADSLDQVNRQLAESGQGQFDYSDASMSLISNDITLKQVNFQPAQPDKPGIKVDSVRISGLEKGQQQLPASLRVSMDNIELRLNEFDTLLAETDMLSRSLIEDNFDVRDNTLYLHYDAEMGYDYNAQTSALDAFSNYRSEDMLDSDITLQIVNLPQLDQTLDKLDAKAMQQQQADMMMQVFSDAGLTRLQFSYQDRGLMQKLYQSAAADPEMIAAMQAQGLEPNVDNLKQTLLTALDESVQNRQREVTALEQELTAHLRRFLAADQPMLNVTLSSVKPEGLKFTDFLVLMMSNGHPDIANSLVNIEIDSGAPVSSH